MPTYIEDKNAAADRHFQDGTYLHDDDRYDNAAYHYGLAAECALKHRMKVKGISLDAIMIDHEPASRRHFPQLRLLELEQPSRSCAKVLQLMKSRSLMRSWHVRMRYASATITEAECLAWKVQAQEFLTACRGV